ncbi:MAG TPA: DEAD/DEAH box helicase, partial [Thermoanaerobaculia bacterium]
MPKAAVTERVLDLPSFQRELRKLTLVSVAEQFPMLAKTEEIRTAIFDLNYLLECASVLAHSDRGPSQDAALRVAHFVLSRPTATDGQKAAAAIILDVLTNRPALGLAVKRDLVAADVLETVPPPLRLDALRREVQFSVADVATGELAMLNRFQMHVYRSIEDVPWVSVSAPTSSGKSFILERAVRDAIMAGTARRVVYIVPTRALVQEVELDFRDKLAGITPLPLITSVPQLPPHEETAAIVLVFTQERLQLLMSDTPDFAPDFVVVDEAQKIGEGARGVLLEQVLDEVARRAPNVRIVFASPMTENPEVLLEYAPASVATLPVSSEQVAVNQNLLWVSQVKGKPMLWQMELCLRDEVVALGTFALPHKPAPESKRLPFVAAALGLGGGNLVYVKGAAAAEDVARLLAEHFRTQKSDDAELVALRDLARKTIHEDYALADTVLFGVAFHYGNMPLIIRSEIERLFRAGKLRYLVCTSTLIEGVNLPATSIFVRGPQKGVGKPMNEIDFWNLAGRAGRQGKEFQGNIICVDPRLTGVWKSPPPTSRRRYVIERNTRRVLTKRADELIDYIVAGTPRSTTREYEELESSFVYV